MVRSEGSDWVLPEPADPAAGRSAAARHDALVGRAAPRRDGAALADLLGPVSPAEARLTRNWAQGAAGERLTARVLAPLAHAGWAVLHDRRLPGAANIDHLVIGPPGVWVIDSKAYAGRIKVLGDGRLWYGKTCLDEVLRVVRWGAERVAASLGVRVASVLCIHGARLPRDQLRWDGVLLTGPAALVPLLAGTTGLSVDSDVAELARRAAIAFPPARPAEQGDP